MQLILETENANIDIRQKMSLEESLNEKLIANGDIEPLQDSSPALPNGNKEKEKTLEKGNIVVTEENSSLYKDTQILDEVAPTQPIETEHVSTDETRDDKEQYIVSEQNHISETVCNASGNNTNGISNHEKDNVESQSDIVHEAEVNVEKKENNHDNAVCTENNKESEVYDEGVNAVETQKGYFCTETKELLNSEKEKVATDQEKEGPVDIIKHVDVEKDVKKSVNSEEKIDIDPEVTAKEANVDVDQDVVNPVNSEEMSVDIDRNEETPINTEGEALEDIDQIAVGNKNIAKLISDTNKTGEHTTNCSSELEIDVVMTLKEGNLESNNQNDVPMAACSEEVPSETKQEENQLKPTSQVSTISPIEPEKLTTTDMDCDEEIDASVAQTTDVTSPKASTDTVPSVIDTQTQSILNDEKTLEVPANESKELGQNLMDYDETPEITSKCKDFSENMMDCDEINEMREILENDDSKKNTSDVVSEGPMKDVVEKVLTDDTARELSEGNENVVAQEVNNEKINSEKVTETTKSDDVISIDSAKSDINNVGTVNNIEDTDNISKKPDEIDTSNERTTEARKTSSNVAITEIVTSQNNAITPDKKIIDSEVDGVAEIKVSENKTEESAKNKTEESAKTKTEESANNKTEESAKNKTEESANGAEESVKRTEESAKSLEQTSLTEKVTEKKKTAPICRLSNTLNILSDDEDDVQPSPRKAEDTQTKKSTENTDKQCINIEDDDDIMVIDEDTAAKDEKIATTSAKTESDKAFDALISEKLTEPLKDSEKEEDRKNDEALSQKEPIEAAAITEPKVDEKITNKIEIVDEKVEKPKPLVPDDFFKSYKKNLAEMTRDDLEEFCVLKIVESMIDRSNLNEIRTKLKTMAQNFEEYKKKAMMLTKQNRDLQVVLKSVQEEQKKANLPITPLKITRSVGMQVLMTDKNTRRKTIAGGPAASNVNKQVRINQNIRPLPQVSNNSPQIPVPRLVPATATNNLVIKSPTPTPVVNSGKSPAKTASPIPNGIRNTQSAVKPEKRSHSKMLTVDLTEDEPPSKVVARNAPAPPVRLVPPQNLLTPRATAPSNNPNSRKVYIPISAPQGQNVNVRPGQAIMLKSVPPPGPRQRSPIGPMVRIPQNAVRMGRVHPGRHPAPLPDSMKQYQPPNWKALPPAPDLKLSKVENGIVISWKIEGYQEDSYEEIASYQLYAYQETSSPPSTALWKKIGDVKALPLPMACTLTQFMAGYKYYFAVRAVDVRSRLGPFSLPGSILLLNKM